MDITINGSAYYGLDTIRINPVKILFKYKQYTTNYSNIGNEYYHDINIEITKKV